MNDYIYELYLREFIALNRKILKNVGFRVIFILCTYGSYKVFLCFAVLVPLCLAELSVHTAVSLVWMAASSEILESAMSCCTRAFLFSIYSFTYRLCRVSLLGQYHLVYF